MCGSEAVKIGSVSVQSSSRINHRGAIQRQDFSTTNAMLKEKIKIDRDEMDRTNAMEKLKWAARSFDGRAGVLEGFKGSDMTKVRYSHGMSEASGVPRSEAARRRRSCRMTTLPALVSARDNAWQPCQRLLNLVSALEMTYQNTLCSAQPDENRQESLRSSF